MKSKSYSTNLGRSEDWGCQCYNEGCSGGQTMYRERREAGGIYGGRSGRHFSVTTTIERQDNLRFPSIPNSTTHRAHTCIVYVLCTYILQQLTVTGISNLNFTVKVIVKLFNSILLYLWSVHFYRVC